MKIALQSQNPLEWLALQSGIIPQPILLAHFGFMISKIMGEALETGIIDALANKGKTAAEIAQNCDLNEKAVTAMLQALVGLKLVKYRSQIFSLTAASKKWLLTTSPQSYKAQLLFDSNVCYDWMGQVGSFLRTGQGLQYHDWMQPKEWNLYQNGMESTAQMLSRLAAAKIRISGSASLLDIGGAHGLYSIELLKKNAGLKAEILDLPEAVAVHANKLNAYPNRLIYTAGNILTDDLPKEKYDVVIMANVAHHFTEIENIAVAKKVFEALKPGGSFYILEFFQKDMAASAKDMIGALQSFFFSFSSTSGLWSANAIKNWLQQANFTKLQIKPFLQLPGFGLVTGKKG